jgi:hypothetical protein
VSQVEQALAYAGSVFSLGHLPIPSGLGSVMLDAFFTRHRDRVAQECRWLLKHPGTMLGFSGRWRMPQSDRP